ncbi:MAG: hypothetical protein RIS52_2058 [Pseudomonadota bacterium]
MRWAHLIFVAVAFVGVGTATVSAQSVDEERRALESAKAQSTAAEARAAKLEDQAYAASNEADRARSEMAAIAARIQASEADITAGEQRIKMIEDLRDKQRAVLAAKQKPIARLLAALQMMARRPLMLSFVQPGSTSDLVHTRAVLSTVIPEIRRKTEGLRAEIAKAQLLKGQILKANTLLEKSKVRLAEQRKLLATEAARFRTQSQRFAAGAIEEQDRAMALGEKARDIVDLIDQLGANAVVRDALASLPGPVLRPARPDREDSLPEDAIPGRAQFTHYRIPVAGTLVSGLGEVSGGGVRERGLTIQTRAGALVVAPAAGRVAYAATYRGYGHIIIIDHGGGWTTLITNLSVVDVRVGDQLSDGSPLGRAGTDHPTIKVELRQGNTPVDITPLLG